MANIKANQTNIIVGLGVNTHTCLSTSMYIVSAQATVNPDSSLSIVISQSGSVSNSVTSTPPGAAQTHIEVQKEFNCAAGDVITFTASSSALVDNQLNSVKIIEKVNPGTI